MARIASDPEAPESFNLTPMIDVTFQLLIFFMLVSDMSNAQVEPLTLPSITKADDYTADESRLVLNVRKDGSIRLQGRLLFDPASGGDPVKLESILDARRHLRRLQVIPGRPDRVTYPLLIRCDRSTEFQHLQRILMIASLHGGIARIELGGKVPNPGEPRRIP